MTLLAGVLVALELALWLAPQGLARANLIIKQAVGPKLVRAEVIESTGGSSTADWRIDRGIIVSTSAGQLTLREADGRVQAIGLGSTTQVVSGIRDVPLLSLASGWRVLVTWAANGTAGTVQVEARRGKIAAPVRSALSTEAILPLFGPKLVRAEVIDSTGGSATADWRIDRGTIVSTSVDQLTLREADGRVQAIAVDSSTRVVLGIHRLALGSLKPGWRVLATWSASGSADLVQVEHRGAKNATGYSPSPRGNLARATVGLS